MKSVETRIERLEASAGVEIPPLVCVVRSVSRLDSNGEPITPGELIGMEIHGGEFVSQIPGESRKALIARATAIAEPHRAPRCGIVLLERYGQ